MYSSCSKMATRLPLIITYEEKDFPPFLDQKWEFSLLIQIFIQPEVQTN